MRVAFVCWGNICRSPVLERVFQRHAAQAGIDVEAESFGISAEELGNPIDRRAQRVLRAAGYDAGGHRARQVRAADAQQVDLFVAAEDYHRERLARLAPDADIRLVTDFIPGRAPGEPMVDPWYGTDAGFDDTLADAEAAMPALLAEVRRLAG